MAWSLSLASELGFVARWRFPTAFALPDPPATYQLVRMLNLIDEHSRECLMIRSEPSWSSGKGVLCRSSGANLTETSPGSYARKMDEAHGVIERIYRNVLSGAPLDTWFARRSHGNSVSPVRRRPCPNPCLVPKSGAVPTAYRPAESVSLVQTRNPSNHRGSRVECDSSFATPCTKQKISRGSEALDARLRASLSTGCRVDRKRQRTLATRSPSPP